MGIKIHAPRSEENKLLILRYEHYWVNMNAPGDVYLLHLSETIHVYTDAASARIWLMNMYTGYIRPGQTDYITSFTWRSLADY